MKRRLQQVARWALTAVILAMLVVFASRVDWAATWAAVRNVSLPLFALAAVVNLASLALKGVRWWIFLRAVGADSLWLAIRATFAGAGLNNVLVANGGEAARVIFVSRATGVTTAGTLATLALERLFEFAGYVVMLALAVTFLPLPPEIARFRALGLAGFAIVVGVLVYLVRRQPRAERADAGTGMGARFRSFLDRFVQTLSGISTGPRFTVSLAISVLVWGLQVLTYQLTAMAAGFPISVVGTVACIIAVNLGFALRATPGNVGVFQMLYALAATAFGLDKDAAIGVAFLIQTQQILPITALGVLAAPEFIFRRGRASPTAPRPAPDAPGARAAAEGPPDGDRTG